MVRQHLPIFRNKSTAHPIKAFSMIYFLSGFYSDQAKTTRYRHYCSVADWLIFVVLFATVYQLLTSPSVQKESLSVSFVVCISYSLTLYYSICFRLQSAKILEVISLMDQARSSLAEALDNGRVFDGFEMDVKNNKFYTRFGSFASFMSAFLFSIQPLIRSTGFFGMDGRKQLQIDIWCPFDYKLPVLFEFIVLIQFCTVFMVALRFFANDSFYMFLFQANIRFFSHLNCLGENVFKRERMNWRRHEIPDRVLNLKLLQPIVEENVLGKDNHNEDPNVYYYKEFEHFNSKAEEKLKLFVINHQVVLSCSQKVCDVYGPVMLMYLLSLMGFASVGAYGVMHTKGFEGVQSIGVSFFSIANLLGMYFMCKAGDDLAEKSVEVAGEMVGAGFLACSPRVGRLLVIVLQRVTVRVQACVVGTPTMPLTCNTFAWFIKTLVSFYLFLVQVQGVKNG